MVASDLARSSARRCAVARSTVRKERKETDSRVAPRALGEPHRNCLNEQ